MDEAEKWLKRAIVLMPNESEPKVILAEAYYRGDDFAAAGALGFAPSRDLLKSRCTFLASSVGLVRMSGCTFPGVCRAGKATAGVVAVGVAAAGSVAMTGAPTSLMSTGTPQVQAAWS